jgi:hypothetical protein
MTMNLSKAFIFFLKRPCEGITRQPVQPAVGQSLLQGSWQDRCDFLFYVGSLAAGFGLLLVAPAPDYFFTIPFQ